MQRHTDIASIKVKIKAITKRFSIDAHVRDIDLIQAEDGEGEDFLRVQVTFDTLASVTDGQLEELMLSIEAAVSELDERTASVRFAELA